MAALAEETVASLIDRILQEGPIGLSTGGRLLGSLRDGKPVHPATLSRWIGQGIRLADGTRLRLEAITIGSKWVTSRAALIRFIEKQQLQQSADCAAEDAVRSPSSFDRSAKRAGDELQRMGA